METSWSPCETCCEKSRTNCNVSRIQIRDGRGS